jgi:hypothetical protein
MKKPTTKRGRQMIAAKGVEAAREKRRLQRLRIVKALRKNTAARGVRTIELNDAGLDWIANVVMETIE